MSRSNLITYEGAVRLRNELADLWKNQRPAVTKALADAAAEGDRSENAEYIYRKKQLREMDRRIRYLQKRTREIQVIDLKPTDQSKVFFGAWIELSDEDDDTFVYRIVGSDEFDVDKRYITIDSPLARGLIKKTVDDEVVVQTPKKSTTYFINKIWY